VCGVSAGNGHSDVFRWHSSVALFIFALVGYFLTVVLPWFLRVVVPVAWP